MALVEPNVCMMCNCFLFHIKSNSDRQVRVPSIGEQFALYTASLRNQNYEPPAQTWFAVGTHLSAGSGGIWTPIANSTFSDISVKYKILTRVQDVLIQIFFFLLQNAPGLNASQVYIDNVNFSTSLVKCKPFRCKPIAGMCQSQWRLSDRVILHDPKLHPRIWNFFPFQLVPSFTKEGFINTNIKLKRNLPRHTKAKVIMCHQGPNTLLIATELFRHICFAVYL